MENGSSLVENLKIVFDRLAAWIRYDLPDLAFDSATWLFAGNSHYVAAKLLAALLMLVLLFVYAFRSPLREQSLPLAVWMVLMGVFFWGLTLMVAIAIFHRA